MPLLVMKFGGTSVADLDRIRNAAEKVKREVERGYDVIVIVSAMSGKTNELVGWVEQTSPLYDAREYDAVVASGENVTAGLMALTLQEMDVPARSWQGWQVPINTTSAHAAALACRIEDFIAMVVEYEDTSDAGQEKRARFLLRQRISQYIRSKIEDQDLTPREIALRLGISVSYLHRVFNEHGTTVSAYIMDQRLNLAYERLASANGLRATVAEVAYSTGFKNPSHFCKAFAGRYNKAPSDVRPKSM